MPGANNMGGGVATNGSEDDLIRRGQALDVVRDAMLDSASLDPLERTVTQRNLRYCLKHIWYAQAVDENEVQKALRELVTAVRYADPPRDFSTSDEPNLCHEARVPTDFVLIAERALAAATVGGDGTAPGEASQSGAESVTPTLHPKYQFDLDTMTARIEELEEALDELLSGCIDVSGTALILSKNSDEAREIIKRARVARGETVK